MKQDLLLQQDVSPRQRWITRWLYAGVTASFVIPIVFLVLRMVLGGESENRAGQHSDADYLLMLVECVLGLVVINIPSFLARRFQFRLPVLLYCLYIVFLYCAIFLGEVRSFYYLIPFWDTILHAFSSMMIGFFGLMVITILNRDEHTVVALSPFFTALFAFSFAVTIGTLWEIYEFAFDGMLGLNMQKFMLDDGTLLTGHEAVSDTMKDIIVDVIGALVSSTIGFFAVRGKKTWMIPELIEDEVTQCVSISQKE